MVVWRDLHGKGVANRNEPESGEHDSDHGETGNERKKRKPKRGPDEEERRERGDTEIVRTPLSIPIIRLDIGGFGRL
jgi:hypothetical protein